jgi:hypothetical protein
MAMSERILRSYFHPRRAMRELLAGGRREDRALAHLMGACLLIFVAQWPRLAREAHLDEEMSLRGLMAGALFAWLFLAPILFYGLAALVHLGARLAGLRSSHYSARAVTFWSLLAVSPLWLVQGFFTGLLGPGMATALLGFGVLAAFGMLLVSGLREAALEPPAASA